MKNTEHFSEKALDHILVGEVNKRGMAVGYHYDGIDDTIGKIIKGTESKPNKFGIYEAKVEVNGIPKKTNGGKSTFFPDNWDSQKVIDTINEAYLCRKHKGGNLFISKLPNGLEIEMFIDLKTGKIISAYPKY